MRRLGVASGCGPPAHFRHIRIEIVRCSACDPADPAKAGREFGRERHRNGVGGFAETVRYRLGGCKLVHLRAIFLGALSDVRTGRLVLLSKFRD